MTSSTIEKKMRSIKAIIYAVFIAGVLTGCTVKNDGSTKCQSDGVNPLLDALEIESDRTCDKFPIVTLRGSDRIEINSFDDYREFGAIASDAEDGELTINISDDLANERGTYSVTYTATDSAGNTVSVERIVVIGETSSADNPDLDDAGSDNLAQSTGGDTGGDTGGTGPDPVAPTIALPVDFEEAADTYEIAGFDGGVASVEAGPEGANSLKYVKGAGQNSAGVWINLDTAVDAANGEIVTADVHSTVARDITLKFDAANVERVASHTGSGWESLSFDFTGAMPANQTKIAFFNDLSQQGDGTDAWTIYIDNLAQTSVAPGPVDSDNDGVNDDEDAFPNDASETADSDNDGSGDNADAFPNDATETIDSDNDGTGDNADAFPNDASETADTDSDGTGDNVDAFPNDASETADTDNDGTGDNADAFPNDASETADTDSDGTGDNADAFPNDASETADSDNDGVGDNADYAPNDPNVSEAPTVPATPTGGLVLDFENVTDPNAEYPPYDTVVSIGQKIEVDGVTSRKMLVIDNGPGPWWSGVNLVVEYSESNLIGDGSAPITMRVFADQDGNLNLELEADGQASYIMNSFVTAGWNDLSFDVSGADASINWHKVQIRPDALGQVDNTVATKYYIDDIHFANATIVQPPADPSSEAFLAGAVTPSVIDAVSLFSDVYTPSALNTVGITGWSNPNTAGSEITINNDNIIKKFEQTIFAGFDVPTDFSIAGKTTMSVSLYRQASSEFEIKLVDLTDGAGEMIYTIPTAEMPIDQWSIIDIDLSDFTGSVENIDQVVIKPMAGAETFYMDDMYFHGTVAPVETIISIPELAAATQHVYVSESTKSEDGTQETIVIRYNADDTTTTGLGLRIHFDSSVLSASDVTALVGTDLLVNGAVESDDGDLDGDASTDQIISFGWASLFGNWPGSAPADLASITFDVAEGATGSSAINFTSSSNAAGFAFDGQSQILGINSN
jgi:hypothetical protein